MQWRGVDVYTVICLREYRLSRLAELWTSECGRESLSSVFSFHALQRAAFGNTPEDVAVIVGQTWWHADAEQHAGSWPPALLLPALRMQDFHQGGAFLQPLVRAVVRVQRLSPEAAITSSISATDETERDGGKDKAPTFQPRGFGLCQIIFIRGQIQCDGLTNLQPYFWHLEAVWKHAGVNVLLAHRGNMFGLPGVELWSHF